VGSAWQDVLPAVHRAVEDEGNVDAVTGSEALGHKRWGSNEILQHRSSRSPLISPLESRASETDGHSLRD
jgi:hypothetical protein